MNPEIKQRWVQALLSGNYKQGKGYLRQDVYEGPNDADQLVSRYCCLGVLCDIVKSEVNGEWETDETDDMPVPFIAEMRSNDTLPPSPVEVYCGLDREQSEELAIMNDRGYNFNRIADYIEKNL